MSKVAVTLFADVQVPGGPGDVGRQRIRFGGGQASRSEREFAVQLAAPISGRRTIGRGRRDGVVADPRCDDGGERPVPKPTDRGAELEVVLAQGHRVRIRGAVDFLHTPELADFGVTCQGSVGDSLLHLRRRHLLTVQCIANRPVRSKYKTP
jgi:hypothetical protein